MKQIKNFGSFQNENLEYPYENRNILVLTIEYVKRGVKQQSNIQFNDGQIFTKQMSVDYEGTVKFPDNTKTIEDVIDFIYDFSYFPSRFVKIVSVKYPSYISKGTTHLLVDTEATNKAIEYLNAKIESNS